MSLGYQKDQIINCNIDEENVLCFSHMEKEKCPCGEKETMNHIYTCKYLNYEEQTTEYEEIFLENVYNQKKVLERFNKNMIKREQHKRK